jgi:hypothetical protein
LERAEQNALEGHFSVPNTPTTIPKSTSFVQVSQILQHSNSTTSHRPEDDSPHQAPKESEPLCIQYKLEPYGRTADRFMITLDSYDAGYIYVCKMSMEYPEQEIFSHKAPCKSIVYSQGAKYLLTGAEDGTIFVRMVS